MTTVTQKIPSGYKQTEIGMIPADWRISSINDLGTIIDGDRGSNYPNGDDFSEYGYCLFLNAKNVTKNGFRFEDVQFIKKEKDAVLSKGKLKRGDIVLTTRGTVGNIAFFDKDIPHENIRINSGMVIIRIDAINGVTPDYYHKLTQSNLLTNQIDRLVFGSAQPQLTVKSIATFQFPVPTQKNEQKSIVITLSDADALIRKLEKLIEKKKNIKQGVMQELLTGKCRLSGFSGKWEVKKLGELLDYEQPTKYLVKDTEYRDSYTTPVLTAGKTFILGYTNEDAGIYKDLPVIIFDDFTTATKFVDFPFKAKSSAMKMLKPRNKDINLRFVFEKMQMIDFKLGDHKRYWISEYQNIEIDTPKPDEQKAISNVLSDMDSEIEKLESQLTKYQNIKQGMMQTLLTGKIRLLTK